MLHGVEPILSWLTWQGPASVEELASYYGTWRFRTENGDDWRLAIVERVTGRLAGSIALRFVGHPDVADVGYWVGTEFQGRGLGGEALRLACALAFRHLRARAMFAWVFDGNDPSRRILEQAGFVDVRSRSVELADRTRRTEHHLSVVAEDWSLRFEGWAPRFEGLSRLA